MLNPLHLHIQFGIHDFREILSKIRIFNNQHRKIKRFNIYSSINILIKLKSYIINH